MQTDPGEYLLLALLLTGWCVLHSFMISVTVTETLKKRLPSQYRFYRIFFNSVAVITLVPLALYKFSIETETVFDWYGWLRLPQIIFITIGILLFFLGARHYDTRRFLGLAQLNEGGSGKSLSESGRLETSGIHTIIRHPWYSGGILVLWARPLTISDLILNVIFTGYLIIGAVLEEKKLVREFGEQYRQYQNNVSMLFPYKWLRSRFF